LTRGQEVEAEFDENDAVDIVLEPGEFSLHHIRIIHGSGPNRGDDRRMGFTIRYIPTRLHQIHGKDSALLVRGVDKYGHFDHETGPDADLSEAAIANYIAANEAHNAILYQGAAQKGVYAGKFI
jgi:non-heme Fe2+,alpha-ketoglutarate-dependent halogenase